MTEIAPILLAAALATPLLLAIACLAPPARCHALALLSLAPIPGLLAALSAPFAGPVSFAAPALRLTLALDAPGALLLGVAALLWAIAGFYAAAAMRKTPHKLRFAVGWLLTLAGSLGVFIAADLLTFYLVFALVSIPAFALIAHDGDAASTRAGAVYIAFTLLGETVLLLGFVLLAAGEPNGSPMIADVMAALPHSPFAAAAIALTMAGFCMKIGLVPMHGFMPLGYTAAPVAAAAVLSGAAVKAGVIGLIRFLPFDAALPGLSEALTAAGLFSAFYGVLIGVTQKNPKTILAYSSVSQMGVIAAVLGMALSASDRDATLDVAFYGANHLLVKGALFLAVGVAASSEPKRLRLVIWPALLLALGLGGLPLTGGALAKLAVKDTLGGYIVGALANLSAAGTTMLMLHFIARLKAAAAPDPDAKAPAALAAPWLAAAAAALIVPWLIFPVLGEAFSYAVSPPALFDGLWPVLLGAALFLLLRRWGDLLPAVPPGDIVGAEEAGLRALYPIGALMERADFAIRQWPAATLSLATLAILFGLALAKGF